MDNAVIVGTDPAEVVSAQQLRAWSPADVEAVSFRCCGCAAPVFPKAFKPNRRTQAHFATMPGTTHVDCDLMRETAAATLEATGSASCRGPVVRPTRLVITTERKKRADPAPGLPASSDLRPTSRPAAPTTPRDTPSTSAVARSIRPFAAAYMAMTRDEARSVPIDLPGIHANRYQYAFRRIRGPIEPLQHRRVFHGPLRWTGQIHDTAGTFRFELFAGENYNAHRKRFDIPWTLVVDHTNWTPRQRAGLVDEFHAVTTDANGHGGVPWAFALADQNPIAPNELHTAHRAFNDLMLWH